MKILTGSQTRVLDFKALSSGVSGWDLMNQASRGLALLLKEFFRLRPGKFLFLCGRGHNGGDGLLTAARLRKESIPVAVLLFCGKKDLRPDALRAFALARKAGVPLLFSPSEKNLRDEVAESTYLFDALFGTGFQGRMKEEMRRAVQAVNDSGKIVLSCDIPSGLEADTGSGGSSCVRADFTFTIGYPKTGLFQKEGRLFSGSVYVIPLSLPSFTGKSAQMLAASELRFHLPSLEREDHKYSRGHLLIAAGSSGMTGAAHFSVCGAQRSGAGVVSLASGQKVLDVIRNHDPQVLTLPEQKIFSFIKRKRVSALLFGPGCGRSGSKKNLLRKLMKCSLPLVIDGDGIYHYSFLSPVSRSRSPVFRSPVILTPHEGEFSKFTGIRPTERGAAAASFTRGRGEVLVLKGRQTILSRRGEIWFNPTGNALLAQAGSGDLLAGLIGGFLARGTEAPAAASLGVYLHGLAADLAFVRWGRRGVLLDQIAEMVPQGVRYLEEGLF